MPDDPRITNPFQARAKRKMQQLLTGSPTSVTVEGGTEGSGNNQSSAISASVVATKSQAEEMGTALDALSAMFCGYVGQDRELLDTGFEDLVGILEEWRDEVPKTT